MTGRRSMHPLCMSAAMAILLAISGLSGARADANVPEYTSRPEEALVCPPGFGSSIDITDPIPGSVRACKILCNASPDCGAFVFGGFDSDSAECVNCCALKSYPLEDCKSTGAAGLTTYYRVPVESSGDMQGAGGVIAPWSMCGGKGTECGDDRPCEDAQWPDYTCADGYVCSRSNEWWWGCATAEVKAGKMCGGQGFPCNTYMNGPCVDTAWPGFYCESGSSCLRQSDLKWTCKPDSGDTEGPVTIVPYNKCGGRSAPCDVPGSGPCQDAAWDSPFGCTSGTSCVRDNQWWWSCMPDLIAPPPPPPPPSTSTVLPPIGANACPIGWLPAVGTLYDSWPQPGTRECVDYSGCKWAGIFNTLDPGPCGGPCASYRWGVAFKMDGGDGQVCCRFPPSMVANMRMASTWEEKGPSGLLNRRIEVMQAGADNTRTTIVNVLDTCKDSDCPEPGSAGCCSKNTGNGAWTLIDLEKTPASELLGFSVDSPTFDINDVNTKTHNGLRPGASPDALALCYLDLGPVV